MEGEENSHMQDVTVSNQTDRNKSKHQTVSEGMTPKTCLQNNTSGLDIASKAFTLSECQSIMIILNPPFLLVDQ